MNIRKLEWLKKTLGPGILFASTAIGVSHLVQSTRAGANYGFGLLFFIVIANIFKYPFFEFGSRYAISTSTSIISGYKRLGNWVLWSYFISVQQRPCIEFSYQEYHIFMASIWKQFR